MKLISWNVNGIRANVKKGGFDWILKQKADIFCIQETKAHPEQLDEAVRNPEGYHSYFDHSKGRKGYSGVAIYTKEKADKVEYGLGIPEYDQEGRFLAIFYNSPSKMVVITCYFPNAGRGPERLDFKMGFYDEFLKFINKQRKAGYEVIFCGDINTAHNSIDLARPKENEKNTGFLPQEREWIDQVIQAGYIDTYRYENPNKKNVYTYWDVKTSSRERNVGWRIDYFFVSPALLSKVNTNKIHSSVMGSDHCPIELSLK